MSCNQSMASLAATATMLSALLAVLFVGISSAQLTTDFYNTSCPDVASVIKFEVRKAIANETRMGASLLRLFFHDCFVNGCDGSLLLDDTPSFKGEKTAAPNFGSARGFEVVDAIKEAVEEECPGIVSCADVLAITAREAVVALGGPFWHVKLGRRDSLTASQLDANNSIPPPTSNLTQLQSFFGRVGLSTSDLVALSGAHTVGFARCTNFRDRVYNETNIDHAFAQARISNCPKQTGSGDNNLAPLDAVTQYQFDNNYFGNLVSKKGLLHSDQQIFNGGSTDAAVRSYSKVPSYFFSQFAKSMIRMGDIQPLTDSKGEVRRNCRRVNSS